MEKFGNVQTVTIQKKISQHKNIAGADHNKWPASADFYFRVSITEEMNLSKYSCVIFFASSNSQGIGI